MWQTLNNWLDSIDAVTGSGSVTFALILAFAYIAFCVIMAVILRQWHNDQVRFLKRLEEYVRGKEL